MEFYEMLSDKYDEIFTVSEKELSFLMDSVPDKNSSILDVACGTGQFSIELFKRGYKNIQAFDLDGSMIQKARSKNSHIDFKVGNMLYISEYYDQRFDFIFCTGNSVAHLEDLDQINSFFKSVYSMLNDDGIFVCQIINYDRIISGNITSLPTIKTSSVCFERIYTSEGNKVVFTGILTSDQNKTRSDVVLLIIMNNDINIALRNAGFDKIKRFGSFSKEHYIPQSSYALILKASK